MSRSGSKSQSGSRKSYHHGDLRDALLEAAKEMIAESGVEALTLRAVARHAGVSTA
ncbi:MAG: TetR family transcriptional regulator, partial [Trueperaceae bacterium]|nr:TetR family transcriptional regulator [Trueperaceae bacterium]